LRKEYYDLFEDNRGGRCVVHNDFDDKLEDFKEKFLESFDDIEKTSKDLGQLRSKFAVLLSYMMNASNSPKDIYMNGMTPFHSNFRLVRVYISTVFTDNTFTEDQIRQFMTIYFTSFDYNENRKNSINELTEETLRMSFRNAILNNFNFGLKRIKQDFVMLFNKFYVIRIAIENAKSQGNKSLEDSKKDEMNDLKDEIVSLLGNDKAFKVWNKDDNSYSAMNQIKMNITTDLFKQRLLQPIIYGTNDFDEICDYTKIEDEEEAERLKKKKKEYDYQGLYEGLLSKRDITYDKFFS
jgi:hypothetical protein